MNANLYRKHMSPDWAAVVVAMAAAVISLISIGVAIASVAYARRQAKAAEKSHTAQFDPFWRVKWLRYQGYGELDFDSGEHRNRPEPDPPFAVLEQASEVIALHAQVQLSNGWTSPQDASPGWQQRLSDNEAAQRHVNVRYRGRSGQQVLVRVPVPPSTEAEHRWKH